MKNGQLSLLWRGRRSTRLTRRLLTDLTLPSPCPFSIRLDSICSFVNTWQWFADAVHASNKVPESIKQKAPKGNPAREPKQRIFCGSKAIDFLPGFKYRNYRTITDDAIEAWLDYEKRGWKGLPDRALLDLA